MSKSLLFQLFGIRDYSFLKVEIELLYNVVLVCAVDHHESGTSVHMPPPSWASLPPPALSSPLGHHGALSELHV